MTHVQNGRFIRLARRTRTAMTMYKRRLGQWLLHSPLHRLYLALRPGSRSQNTYAAWIEACEAALPSLECHRQRADAFAWRPTITVVMPVRNSHHEWLHAAIDSVLAQSYPHWELCICDDSSDDPWIAEYVSGLASKDPRIRFIRSDQRLGIAGALNAASSLASGDYVTFLDHDDLLHRFALHYIAEACQDRQADIIYSDEDFIDESGRRVHPQFKPDWSPDLLLGCMYFGHLFVVARQSAARAGWFRTCCEGSQDYDLALRITSGPVRVRHVPIVLYHWRRHAHSTAGSSDAKPYTHAAGRKTLEDAIRTRNIRADVRDGPAPNTYYVHRTAIASPLVSIVVASRHPKRLAQCLRSLDQHTAYRHREVIVQAHNSTDHAGARFNISKLNNLGARAATGKMLVFLTDEVRAVDANWLDLLVAHLERDEVGAVGAKLIYPGGALQHAGIALGIAGGVGHPGRCAFAAEYWPWLDLTRNVSAVSGACLGIRTSVLEQHHGWDESFPVHYGDVDLCLRIRESGHLILYEPHAVLQHSIEDSDTPDMAEQERFRSRWSTALDAPDPYYSPALDRTTEEIRLSDRSGILKIIPSK